MVKKMSFPNHFSLTSVENIMRSRKWANGRARHRAREIRGRSHNTSNKTAASMASVYFSIYLFFSFSSLVFLCKSAHKQLGLLFSCNHPFLEERIPVLRVVSRLFLYHFLRAFCWLWHNLESRQKCRGLLPAKCLVMCGPLSPITRVMCKP